MTQRTPNFARVLAPSASGSADDGGPLRDDEIDGILDIGYAMAVANGHASDEELVSLRALVGHLRPGTNLDGALDALRARFGDGADLPGKVREAAARLGRPFSREVAYKVAYTVAAFDLETNEEERDLDDLLIEVLGVGARVAELEAELNVSLRPAPPG